MTVMLCVLLVPDATTLLKFRHMLEKNKIGEKIFADVSETSKLIREDDHVVYGDSGYLGAPDRSEIKNDETLSKVEFRINKRPSSLKMADDFKGMNWDKKMEHEKSAVRCKVEHPFNLLFASANLIMCSRAGRTKDFISCGV